METGFTKRKARKISVSNLLISFILTVLAKDGSYLNWATKLSGMINVTVSKQAIWKRVGENYTATLKKLLLHQIHESLSSEKVIPSGLSTKLFDIFQNVWLQDSTCLKLDDSVVADFKGSVSRGKTKAVAKIQTVFELKSNTCSQLTLTSFSSNDQSASADVFNYASTGDLMIRDFGYSSFEVFIKCSQQGIFFLSKLLGNTHVFIVKTNDKYDLLKLLQKKQYIDIKVFEGSKQKIPMRLVALKLNQKTTNERIRKAKTNRDRRLNPSKETIALKGLVILITNVSKQVWTSNQVASAYGFRWSIENIFKCWKSAFNMQRFLLGQQSKVRVESIIYSLLVFITLFQLRLYHYWLHKIYKTKNVIISLMKFAKLISENMRKMMESTNDNFIMEQIAYYCKYDKRSDRINYLSSLYGLS